MCAVIPLDELHVTRHHRPPRLRRATMRRERLLRRLGQSAHVPVTRTQYVYVPLVSFGVVYSN